MTAAPEFHSGAAVLELARLVAENDRPAAETLVGSCTAEEQRQLLRRSGELLRVETDVELLEAAELVLEVYAESWPSIISELVAVAVRIEELFLRLSEHLGQPPLTATKVFQGALDGIRRDANIVGLVCYNRRRYRR